MDKREAGLQPASVVAISARPKQAWQSPTSVISTECNPAFGGMQGPCLNLEIPSKSVASETENEVACFKEWERKALRVFLAFS